MKINLTPLTPEEEYNTSLPYLGEDYDDSTVGDEEDHDEDLCDGCEICDEWIDSDSVVEDEDPPLPFLVQTRVIPPVSYLVDSAGTITSNSGGTSSFDTMYVPLHRED